MNDELKQLIEDAAKLLGYAEGEWIEDYKLCTEVFVVGDSVFNPLDPERGDLMKVARAAELDIENSTGFVAGELHMVYERFQRVDHDSLALAILRAASAVYKSRGGV